MPQLTTQQLEHRRAQRYLRQKRKMKKAILAALDRQDIQLARTVLSEMLNAIAYQWKSSGMSFVWANSPEMKYYL